MTYYMMSRYYIDSIHLVDLAYWLFYCVRTQTGRDASVAQCQHRSIEIGAYIRSRLRRC